MWLFGVVYRLGKQLEEGWYKIACMFVGYESLPSIRAFGNGVSWWESLTLVFHWLVSALLRLFPLMLYKWQLGLRYSVEVLHQWWKGTLSRGLEG
jgi:hypothetical protein